MFILSSLCIVLAGSLFCAWNAMKAWKAGKTWRYIAQGLMSFGMVWLVAFIAVGSLLTLKGALPDNAETELTPQQMYLWSGMSLLTALIINCASYLVLLRILQPKTS